MRFVLTLSCPDRIGIVAAISGILANAQCFIIDSNHFGDPDAKRFFMRTVFEAPESQELELRHQLTEVARRLKMKWEMHDALARTRTIIMVSRLEHCLNDLLYRVRTGTLLIDVAAVVSNHEDARSVVEWHGIPYHYYPVDSDTKAEAESKLVNLVKKEHVELIVLARYMQVLSNDLCKNFYGKIINIHHSFLPSFKGAQPYHQAHARGVKLIGATAHYVTEKLDEGPIIEQAVERIDHNLTIAELAMIGRDTESRALARAVTYHAEHRILLNEAKTVVFK